MDIRRIPAVRLRPAVIVAGLIMLAFAAGIYSLPLFLTAQLPQWFEAQTGKKASLGGIELGLFPVRVAVHNLRLQETGGETLLSFEHLDMLFNPLQSIKNRAIQLDKLTLSQPFVLLSQAKNGHYTVQELAGKGRPEEAGGQHSAIPLLIKQLDIVAGQVVWQALLAGHTAKEQLTQINLQVADFSLADNAPFTVRLSLARASGGQLDWQGAASLQPFSSEGHIKLAGLDLASLHELALPDVVMQGHFSLDSDYQLSYANNQLNGAVKQARLTVEDFQYQQADNQVAFKSVVLESAFSIQQQGNDWQFDNTHSQINGQALQLTAPQKVLLALPKLTIGAAFQIKSTGKQLSVTLDNGTLTSQDVQLQAANSPDPLLKIPALTVQGIALNLNGQSLKIASVATKDATIKAWVAADGTINYQTLLATPDTAIDSSQVDSSHSATSPASPQEAAKKPWAVQVDSVTVDNFNAAFEDRSLKTPASINLNAVNIKLNGFSNQPGSKIPFTASLAVNQSGLLKLDGLSVLQPLALHTTVNLSNLDLAKFQPYYDRYVQVDIIDGALSSDGMLDLAQTTSDSPLAVKYNGNIGIEGLVTRDQKTNKDLVKWEQFTLQDLAIDSQANRYSAAELTLNKPYARVSIRKDKSINFDNLLIKNTSAPSSQTKAVATASNATKPWYKLGKLRIIEGSSDFSDFSLILPFAAHIESLDGGASGIASDSNANIKMALSGNAYELAPVDIKGEISPVKGNYDIQVSFSGLPMPLVSPYMVQFAGYKVENGKMNLDLSYKVANQQLTASNKLLIDHFELGEKVDNPNAVTIPIKLAIALLKDDSGKINFDVPVSGSLEDPHFNLATVINNAVSNALAKLAQAPFKAMASLFDNQEKDISSISFSAGESKLEKSETDKLDTIAKALQARPKLNLQIKGAAYQAQDWPAIRDDALYDQLKKRRADELNKINAQKIRPEYVELSKSDYERLLAAMFIEQFPLLADKSFLGTPQLKNQKDADFYEVAKQKLYEIIKPEEERLKGLAIWRAQAIAKYMVDKGGINQERIYILDTALNATTDPADDNKKIISFLTLSAN